MFYEITMLMGFIIFEADCYNQICHSKLFLHL